MVQRFIAKMIDKGVPAPRLLAAGYGAWAPHGLDSVKKANPTWNPLSLTWEEEVKTTTGVTALFKTAILRHFSKDILSLFNIINF